MKYNVGYNGIYGFSYKWWFFFNFSISDGFLLISL